MFDSTGLIHCFPEGLLDLFDSSCLASFSKVFVAGFSITCPVSFLEVDGGSPRPIYHGQFRVDGDEDGQMIAQTSHHSLSHISILLEIHDIPHHFAHSA